LKEIWLAAEQPCGKRLKAALALWLPYYEVERGSLGEALRGRVLGVSAATIDRLLEPCRVALGSRGRCGTRPGTLLRKAIPVRTEHWDVAGPGWVETDTVAHCGESMEGDFCWSLTVTDVHTEELDPRAQLVGYGRLADPAQAELLNDLYAREWGWFRNFFCPAMKHLRTEVEGSRKKRIYDQPLTPFERLKACPGTDPRQLERMEKLMATLNPFKLKASIERKLRRVLRLASRPNLKSAA
jgi:hypothetical protein